MAQLMPLPLTVSCFSKIQICFTFLVLVDLGSPGKGPLNGCVPDQVISWEECVWNCLFCFEWHVKCIVHPGYIRMDEVRAALKEMKRHKAPGLSGLVTEMIQATGDIGTQWILDVCNGIVKEGSIPEDWKSSVILPIYKGKGDPMECGSYRGIKLLARTYL